MSSSRQTTYSVLGASGFIGTNLCIKLLNDPNTKAIKAFGRQRTPNEELESTEWFSGDFTNNSEIRAAIKGCDVVYHLITTTTPETSNQNIELDLFNNVGGTLNIIKACLEEGVQRLVFVSSGGTVYGIPETIPIPEDSKTNPISAYGISKLTVEKYLGLYGHLFNLDYKIMRVANPFGPFQCGRNNQGAIGIFLRRIIENRKLEIWGDGSVIRDYIYIDDVVDALIRATTYEGPYRVFNVGSAQGRSILDLIATLKQVVKRNFETEFHPSRALDVPKNILDISLARKELNWLPKTRFEDGLAETFLWLKNRRHKL